jgi:pyruvate formate lyase activating enzyme
MEACPYGAISLTTIHDEPGVPASLNVSQSGENPGPLFRGGLREINKVGLKSISEIKKNSELIKQLNKNPELFTLDFEREKCSKCKSFDCAAACCTSAVNTGGYYITAGNLYSRIQRDRQYWGEKGGITLTGGEPFAQPEFAASVFRLCYNAYIHTAVETCGDLPWKNIEPSLPWLDWIFFDLKHMNDIQHRQLTSSSNRLILKNAQKLSKIFPGRLVFRMPLIPGINDGPENISATADFIVKTGRKEINILPVHHLGREKFRLAGMPYLITDQSLAGKNHLNNIKKTFEEKGVHCYLGSETPF